MKLVIKPAGIVLLSASLTALVFLALRNPLGGNGAANVAPLPPPSVPAPPAAAPTTPVDWNAARRILEPDIASQNWRLLLTAGKAEATTTVVPASVPAHPFARRTVVAKVGANPWDIQIAHPLGTTFKQGQHLRLTYFARSPESCSIAAVVEQASTPWEKLAYREAQLTPAWASYSEEWDQKQDTPLDWAHIDFQIGKKPGTIEVTGVVIDAVDAGPK